ncbi:V-type ATP synthase subunit I [Ruminococcus sp.]|uniref:V-type ATP synthase subunit I n=1 Tax=Ruminococcus sp. TaxID=41978 RepID=UPI0025D6BB34|nr:V-type ATP synthase subunit I [Ruminococcus sp.]
MAKLKMQKIELVALLTDSKKIIELLQRRGILELCNETDDSLVKTNVTSVISEFEKLRNIVVQSLEVLNQRAPEKKSLLDSFSGKREMEKHEFGKEATRLEKFMQTATEIVRNNRMILENEANLAQIGVKLDTLRQWTALDVPMNFKGTSATACFIGTMPEKITAEELETFLPEQCHAEILFSSKEQTNLFVLCSRSIAEEAYEILRQNAFTPLTEAENKTPCEQKALLELEVECLKKQKEICLETIRNRSGERSRLEFAADYLQMRKDKYEALNALAFTRSTFVLTGYIPEKYADAIAKEIDAKYHAAIRFYAPEENEDVPVLLENGKFSEPVEGITEMYSLPGKKDVDPTPVMSFFYYLFFGMMLSDAGYGIVMVVGTVIALKKLKLEENMRKTLTMFRNCGISTIIFGALFGSWFGDIVQVVGREFFGKEIGSIALWFQPLDDPIRLLLYSFALGIAHLFLGIGVSFKMRWDEGKKLDAFLDTVPVYLTILGVCPLAAGILTDVPGILKTIGGYVAIVGVALLVLTAGRSSKSIFGKFFGGLYALYNTATGYLSDILSYSRLLALGLATGSIAGVINLIGTMPQNMAVKAIMLVVVFLVGHTANLAINLLGAYVHTDRLQFVELFSKFYEGGGRAFHPLKVNSQYVKFKEESIDE